MHCGAGLTSEPIISTPSAGAGPGAGPAAADFVGRHTGWRAASQNCMSPVGNPWGGIHKGSFPSGSAPVPPTCPQHSCDNHRAKRRTHPTSSAGSGHHNTKHTPYQRDNSQHTLRKDVADICTKNSPHAKNIGLTQSIPGHSHVKTALRDHSRKLFLLNSETKNLSQMKK